MTRPAFWVALPLVILQAAGCVSTGTGSGAIGSDSHAVHFSWRSSDDMSGSMTATFEDGRSYSGTFLEVTTDTRVDRLSPLWEGWGHRWYPLWGRGWREDEWDPWQEGPEFIKHYTGQVVANLRDVNGKHLRCTFQLVHPSRGMAGGGTGRCQGPDHRTIDAEFPAG